MHPRRSWNHLSRAYSCCSKRTGATLTSVVCMCLNTLKIVTRLTSDTAFITLLWSVVDRIGGMCSIQELLCSQALQRAPRLCWRSLAHLCPKSQNDSKSKLFKLIKHEVELSLRLHACSIIINDNFYIHRAFYSLQ
jgi:hypothetical protein